MFAATKSFFTNEAAPGGGPTPSWTLDFSSGTPSGYTLTRASSGTYVDSSGYIASASTDVARLTHDSMGARLGLLVEEQRQNLFQRSEEFTNAYWSASNTTVANVASPAAPDNSATADELKETATSSNHMIERIGVNVQAGVFTMSVYVKKQSRRYFGIGFNASNTYFCIFDLDNNAAVTGTSFSGTPNGSSGSQDVGNGWYRIWITAHTGSSGSVTIYPKMFLSDRAGFTSPISNFAPSYTGSTSESIYIWGAQVEAASTVSSYIPTTTASVTRSADLAHVLDSSITSWGDPGALVIHFYPPPQAGTLLSTDDASAQQLGIEASSTTAVRAFWSNGQTATGTMTTGVQKAVHYWNGTASSFCLNGGTVQTGTNNVTTFGNIDFVTFGAEATDSSGTPGTFSNYSNLIIRKIEFYSGTLTSGDLQTITT